VVEDGPYNVRKISSPSSSLLLLAKTITPPAARSFCDSWASCYCFTFPLCCTDHTKRSFYCAANSMLPWLAALPQRRCIYWSWFLINVYLSVLMDWRCVPRRRLGGRKSRPNFALFIHSFIHSFIYHITEVGGVILKWMQKHITTSNEKDEIRGTGRKQCLSCVVEASFWWKYVLSWRLNIDKDDADKRLNGRLFQVLAAAT